MSTQSNTGAIGRVLAGTATKSTENAREAYAELLLNHDLPEVTIEEGRKGVPLTALEERSYREYKEKQAGELEETFIERQYGHENAFALKAAAGTDYRQGGSDSIKALDSMMEKGLVDQSVVGAATPIAVDPLIVDIQRRKAPILSRIVSMAQAGFQAQYNTINQRSAPLGFVSEQESADLSNLPDSDFGMGDESKKMKIWVDKVNISDFSQRAEQTLGYMDLTQTTMGQRVIARNLQKAKAYFYGDSSVNAGDRSVEDANAYDGMAKMAVDAGNDLDKSATSTAFLEDIKSELTVQVTNTGLDYDNAEIFVSPTMFDAIENEANPVVRLTGYDEGVNFGGRSIQIKGVRVTECPNIRGYGDLSGTNFVSDEGDVFIVDRSATQFRALAPLSTLPLGRSGLADKAAMFEYGTLIDKAHGEHNLYLNGYAVGA